jgi:hypothetical protein
MVGDSNRDDVDGHGGCGGAAPQERLQPVLIDSIPLGGPSGALRGSQACQE